MKNTFTHAIAAFTFALSGGLEAKNITPADLGEGRVMNLLHTVEHKICARSGILPDKDILTDYVKIPKNFSLMKQFGMSEKEAIDFAIKNNLLFYFDLDAGVIIKFPNDAYIALTED